MLAAGFSLTQRRSEGAARFGGIAAFGNGVGDVSLEFFVELVIQATCSEGVDDARNQGHFRPP